MSPLESHSGLTWSLNAATESKYYEIYATSCLLCTERISSQGRQNIISNIIEKGQCLGV